MNRVTSLYLLWSGLLPHPVPPRDRLFYSLLSFYLSSLFLCATDATLISYRLISHLSGAFRRPLLLFNYRARNLRLHSLHLPVPLPVSPSLDSTHYCSHYPMSISVPLSATVAALGCSFSSYLLTTPRRTDPQEL